MKTLTQNLTGPSATKLVALKQGGLRVFRVKLLAVENQMEKHMKKQHRNWGLQF